MTPEQIQLVRLTFAQVMEKKMESGRLFYDRLFTIAPDTRPLFKDDINAQASKLMDTLAVAIGSLRDPAALTKVLTGLGQRHTAYGVRDEHYDKVGEALLWTLEKGLGAAFTPDAKMAWTQLYAAVANTMKSAAAPAAGRRAAG